MQVPVSSPQHYGKEKIYTTCGQEKWSASLDIMKIQTRLGRWLNEEELLFLPRMRMSSNPQHNTESQALLHLPVMPTLRGQKQTDPRTLVIQVLDQSSQNSKLLAHGETLSQSNKADSNRGRYLTSCSGLNTHEHKGTTSNVCACPTNINHTHHREGKEKSSNNSKSSLNHSIVTNVEKNQCLTLMSKS